MKTEQHRQVGGSGMSKYSTAVWCHCRTVGSSHVFQLLVPWCMHVTDTKARYRHGNGTRQKEVDYGVLARLNLSTKLIQEPPCLTLVRSVAEPWLCFLGSTRLATGGSSAGCGKQASAHPARQMADEATEGMKRWGRACISGAVQMEIPEAERRRRENGRRRFQDQRRRWRRNCSRCFTESPNYRNGSSPSIG